MLLLISVIEHAQRPARRGQASTNEYEEGPKAAAGSSITVVPLHHPLLTGPASMSTVVIYADAPRPSGSTRRAGGLRRGHRATTAVCFALADPIARVLGKTGINVMNTAHGPDPRLRWRWEVMAWTVWQNFPSVSPSPADRPTCRFHVRQWIACTAAARDDPAIARTVAYCLERGACSLLTCWCRTRGASCSVTGLTCWCWTSGLPTAAAAGPAARCAPCAANAHGHCHA